MAKKKNSGNEEVVDKKKGKDSDEESIGSEEEGAIDPSIIEDGLDDGGFGEFNDVDNF